MAERITWTTPIAAVAGKDANKVTEALGVTQIGQLLSTYPRHWVSKGSLSDLGKLSEGDYLTMFGEIVVSKVLPYQDRRTGRTAYRLEMRVKGEDGALRMTWFDRDRNTSQWRARKMCIGNFGLFAGKLKWFNGEWELTNPRAKMFAAEGEASEAHLAIPDLIAIYKTSGRVDSWQIADAITLALELVDDVPDVLPPTLRERLGLLDAGTALRWIHAPDDQRQLGAAKKRLKYDEAFVTQVVLAQRRRLMASQPAAPRTGGGNLLARFDSQLPFQLTTGQQVVGAQIEADLAREHPMHRLLQGELLRSRLRRLRVLHRADRLRRRRVRPRVHRPVVVHVDRVVRRGRSVRDRVHGLRHLLRGGAGAREGRGRALRRPEQLRGRGHLRGAGILRRRVHVLRGLLRQGDRERRHLRRRPVHGPDVVQQRRALHERRRLHRLHRLRRLLPQGVVRWRSLWARLLQLARLQVLLPGRRVRRRRRRHDLHERMPLTLLS